MGGTLTFTLGKITTGANTLIALGTVAGAQAARFVEGNLQKPVDDRLGGHPHVRGRHGHDVLAHHHRLTSVSVAGNLTVTSTAG